MLENKRSSIYISKSDVDQAEEMTKALENSNWNPNVIDENPRNFTYSVAAIRFAILMVIFGFNLL